MLSIVIVSFNARADLMACLLSLKKAPAGDGPRDHRRGQRVGSDGSAEAAERIPGVRVIQMGRNAGFAAANNAGIRESRGDLLLLLNSDTLVPPGAIDRLVGAPARRRRRRDRRAAAGGRRRTAGAVVRRDDLAAERVPPEASLAASGSARATAREQFVDWVSGACLLVCRADAEAVGLLDERFFLYTEDVDFCHAVRAARTPGAVHAGGGDHAPARPLARLAARREPTASTAAARSAFYRKHHPRVCAARLL